MEQYTLHARQKKLLYILNNEHRSVTGKALSQKLKVSERTIRSDIADINAVLPADKIQIRAIHGKGYEILIADREDFHELFSEFDNTQTKADRVRYLLMCLIRRESWCDLSDLEEEMFVSRTTLENDIREVCRRIVEQPPYIQLERQGNIIRLEDNEGKKRSVLINLYYENWDFHSRGGIILRNDYISQELLDQSSILLKEILKKYRIELDDFGMIYMMLSIAVAYARTLTEHRLKVINYRCRDSHINQAAQALRGQMAALWEVEFEEEEWHWLADIMNQLRILKPHNMTKEQVIKQVSKESTGILDKLINEVKAEYAIDFSSNESFYTNMVAHIQALINGIISVHSQSEDVIEELRMEHPLSGDLAYYFCRQIEQFTGLAMGHKEENYLFPILLSAQKASLAQKLDGGIKVALVSHLNAGMSGCLMQLLVEKYGNRLEIKGPVPVYDRDVIDQMQPAFILTTVQMADFRQFNIPVILISPLVRAVDEQSIAVCMKKIESRYLYPVLPKAQPAYFPPELMIEIERKVGMTEILNIVEENLRINVYVSDDERIDWENCHSALIREGCAFLYVIGSAEQSTIMSVVELRHPTAWHQLWNIEKVYILLLNKNERKYVGRFYQIAQANSAKTGGFQS